MLLLPSKFHFENYFKILAKDNLQTKTSRTYTFNFVKIAQKTMCHIPEGYIVNDYKQR